MLRFFFILATLAILLFVHAVDACAYEVDVHRAITADAVRRLPLALWLEQLESRETPALALSDTAEGAVREDDYEYFDPVIDSRCRHHFHNPVDNRGLHATFTGRSSVCRAYEDDNAFSVRVANAALRSALTASRDQAGQCSTAEDRRLFLTGPTGLFALLGHAVHLLQDAASPPHVRNDEHIPYLFDGSVYEHTISRDYAVIAAAQRSFNVSPLLTLAPSALRSAVPCVLPSSASNLWDNQQYPRGSCNLQPGGPFGLAELTAANFYSEDTTPIFRHGQLANRPGLPCPSVQSLICDEAVREGAYPDGGGFTLCKVQIGTLLVPTAARMPMGDLMVNRTIAERQSRVLVPLAVAHSEAFLSDFFQGLRLDIRITAKGKVELVNNTPVDLAGGTLSIWYDTKDRNDGWRCEAQELQTSNIQIAGNGGRAGIAGLDLATLNELVFDKLHRSPDPQFSPDGSIVFLYEGPASYKGKIVNHEFVAAHIWHPCSVNERKAESCCDFTLKPEGNQTENRTVCCDSPPAVCACDKIDGYRTRWGIETYVGPFTGEGGVRCRWTQ